MTAGDPRTRALAKILVGYSTAVTEGDTGEADGMSFEVLDVVEAEDAGDEPGATGGLIVILPSA